jgi:uncharacterized lipoprotein YajG
MNHKIFKAWMVTAALLSLTACAPKPMNMIFNPLAQASPVNIYKGQNFKIVVQDQRREKHLLKVLDSDGDAVRHAPGSSIVERLTASIKQSYRAQGLNVNDYAGAAIIIDIIQLETVVSQNIASHQAALSAEFKVTVKDLKHTTHKVFVGNSKRDGILRFDIALLERDLNALAQTVMADIYADSYIRQAIDK